MDRGRLRQLLRSAFSEAELQDLCFNLNIDYEELPGRSKLEKIRELIGLCERTVRLPQLIARCQALRPHLDWQEAAEASTATTEQGKLRQAIAALESQRVTLGDAVVDAGLMPLKQQLEALDAPRLSLQHKQVTVLQARRAGFTQMYPTGDLEELRDLVNLAWDRLDAAVVEHGGRVNSRSGDQMTALFGAVDARPDDPARAIKAALAMQAGLAEMKEERDIPLSLQIGISTGSVLLEQVGPVGEFSVIGDAVKVASILEARAPVDGLLIADNTYDQVRGAFNVAPSDPVLVKGRAEPLSSYIVNGVKAIAFDIDRHGVAGVTTRMIGRDHELGQLQEAYFAAAEDHERQVVTITGESGLGKSRLLDEFFDWIELREEGIRVFSGTATAETISVPYGLLRGLLAQRLPGLAGAGVVQTRQILEGHLAEILPGDTNAHLKAHFIGQLLGFDFVDSPHLPEVADDPKQLLDRATLYLIEYFENLARELPVVILIENLQWADDSSLDLLNQLALALGGRAVLIVAAARPEFSDRRPHWGEGYDWHTRLDLRLLTPRESRRLLHEILQKMADPPAPLVQALLDRAAGNPLYMLEIVKTLLRDGVIVDDGEAWVLHAGHHEPLPVPPTLVGILQSNLDALSVAEREELQRAAVVGSSFWNTAVAYMGGGASAEQLKLTDQNLAQLHGREVISRRETSRFAEADEYAFRNAMLRKVAQESVPRRARQVYHALAARWLLEQSGARADEFAGTIANHLERAGQTERAIEWLLRAGDRATARYAHSEAISYYSRTLAMLPESEFEHRVPQLLKREAAHHIQGNRKQQIADLDELESLAFALDDVTLQARVALRRSRYAQALSDYPAVAEAAKNSIALAQQAGAADLAARAYMAWGVAFTLQANYAKARHRLEQALAQSRIAVQPKLEADSLRLLGNLSWYQGEFVEARTTLEKALAVYRRIGNQWGENASLSNLAVVAQQEGNYSGVRTYHEQALSMARQRGDRRGEAFSLINLGVYEVEYGDYAGARVHTELGLTIFRQIDNRNGEAWSMQNLGLIDVFEGEFARAREHCERALAIQRAIGERNDQGYGLTYLGHALAGLGESDSASKAYQEALTLRREVGQNSSAMGDLAGLARVEMAQGDLKKASDRVNEILAWFENHGTGGIEHLLEVQLTCHRVLRATADGDASKVARATDILSQAHTALMAQAEAISDASQRKSFLENVKVNREIIAAWEERGEMASNH